MGQSFLSRLIFRLILINQQMDNYILQRFGSIEMNSIYWWLVEPCWNLEAKVKRRRCKVLITPPPPLWYTQQRRTTMAFSL